MRCVSVLLHFSTVILILNAECYIRRIWVWHWVGFPSMSVVVSWLVITLLTLCQMEITVALSTEVLRGQSINDCVSERLCCSKVISDHTKSFCVLNEPDPLACPWPCVLASLSLCPHMCTQTYRDEVVVIHLADAFIQGYLGRSVKFRVMILIWMRMRRHRSTEETANKLWERLLTNEKFIFFYFIRHANAPSEPSLVCKNLYSTLSCSVQTAPG